MKKNLKLIGLSLVSCLALFLDYSFFQFKSFEEVTYIQFYHMNVLLMAFMMIILYFLYKKNEQTKISKSKVFLCWLFAMFMVIGEAIVTKGTFTLIYKSIINVILTIVKGIGYANLFKIGFCYLDLFLKKKWKQRKCKNKKIRWYLEQFEKHPFKTSFITIVIAWSIYMVAFYPIVLSPDPSFQIRQYYNVPTKYIDWVIQRDPNVFMTAHHPVLQTFLLGWSIDLGRFLINDNFGLFIYSFFQSMIYISVFVYTIAFSINRGVKRNRALLLLGLYLIVPMFAFYSISAVKDTLYTSFMILFVLIVYDIIERQKMEKMSFKTVVFFSLVMLLICLFRHNGLYVIALTIPFIWLYSKPNRLYIIAAFLFAFFSINMVDKVIVPSLGISDGSIREMLSVPFQQTARYVLKHESELSDEEKQIIDKILVYDTLKERYNPELADDVKNEYNKNATTEDLKEYFKVWGRGLIKHPTTYIDATLNNTYGYFYPNTHKWYVYTTYDTRVTKNHLVHYHFNKLEGLRAILSVYGNIFPYIPGIGLIASIGFNMWILLIVSAYLITNRKKKYLIPLVPLYGSLLICFISPANTYFRYTMPYVFVLPTLIVLLWNHIRGDEVEKK